MHCVVIVLLFSAVCHFCAATMLWVAVVCGGVPWGEGNVRELLMNVVYLESVILDGLDTDSVVKWIMQCMIHSVVWRLHSRRILLPYSSYVRRWSQSLRSSYCHHALAISLHGDAKMLFFFCVHSFTLFFLKQRLMIECLGLIKLVLIVWSSSHLAAILPVVVLFIGSWSYY